MDAVHGDYGAEAASQDLAAEVHTFHNDSVAEEGVDQGPEAVVAAHETRRDADNAPLAVDIERGHRLDRVQRVDEGASRLPHGQGLDSGHSAGHVLEDESLDVLRQGRFDGRLEAGGHTNDVTYETKKTLGRCLGLIVGGFAHEVERAGIDTLLAGLKTRAATPRGP